MKLLIATTNRHKLEEIESVLHGENYEIISLLDYPGAPEVIEDGTTFQENAIKKAREYADYTGLLTLADDSGLEIDALGGQPGVLSARFAGPGATGRDLCAKVIGLMSNVPWERRTARFRCVIALIEGGRVELAEGTVEGYIIEEMRGAEGFGYDPIFYYPPLERTFAQIGMQEKNTISHRGKALVKAKMLLEKKFTIR